jgi:hypothetical protein
MKDLALKDKSKRHQLLLENIVPTKTTHIMGYGLGVTFSSNRFSWSHNFSSVAELMQFSQATFSK